MKGTSTKKNGKTKRGNRGMGYLYKRGGAYWLEYRPGGERIRQALRDSSGEPITTKDEAEAERLRIVAPFMAKDKVEAQRQILSRLQAASEELGAAANAATNDIRIADAWTAYIALPPVTSRKAQPGKRPDTGEATLEVYRQQWERFAKWMAATHTDAAGLGDIGEDIANEYITRLDTSGISANTRNKHVDTLARIVCVLSDRAKVTSNPFAGRRRGQKPHTRNELTTEELRKLIDGTTGELRLLLALGTYTGMRRGDCCTLLWDEVDLKRGHIIRVPNKTARRHGDPVTIPLFTDLAAMLAKAKKSAAGDYVLPGMADLYNNRRDTLTANLQRHFLNCGIDVHRKGTGKRIKRDKKGTPLRHEKSGNVITEATGKRAIVAIGFHSLRHSFVSLCREANAPLSVVESIVGHSNPAMTRHYTHTSEAEALKAVAALPSITGKGKAKPQREPLPDWARGLLEKQSAMNWKKIRDEVLKGAAA
jgi:integrase